MISFARTAILVMVATCSCSTVASAQGTFLFSFGGPGPFDGAAGIATTCCGDRILVADRNRHVVEVFDRDGLFVESWGSFGTGLGQFDDPDGISVDCSGRVHVADEDNQRVQRFALDGSGAEILVTGLRTPRGVSVTRDGSSFWVAQRDGASAPSFQDDGSPGPEALGVNQPFDVTAGCPGRVYVADTFGNRVAAFDLAGTPLLSWTVDQPIAIAADCACNIYVGSRNTILHFSADGAPVSAWGSPGSGPGQFLGLFGLAADGLGRVYSVETVNQRVQVFEVPAGGASVIVERDSRCLWAPNHRIACLSSDDFQPVVSGGCGTSTGWVLVGCDADQPEDALGDGAFAPDCWIDAEGRVCVRVERQGMDATGRTYGVLAVPRGGTGCGSPQRIADIHVPRDRREHEECVRAH